MQNPKEPRNKYEITLYTARAFVWLWCRARLKHEPKVSKRYCILKWNTFTANQTSITKIHFSTHSGRLDYQMCIWTAAYTNKMCLVLGLHNLNKKNVILDRLLMNVEWISEPLFLGIILSIIYKYYYGRYLCVHNGVCAVGIALSQIVPFVSRPSWHCLTTTLFQPQ